MTFEVPPASGAAAFGVARSFTGRRWQLKSVDAEIERELLREISPVLARLLALRGVTLAQAADYLAPKLKNLLPDPFVLKDMDLAVARVAAALVAGERIAVFGDYDVDGSTSAALLSALNAGDIQALVAQNPTHMGYLAVKTMVAHLKGEKQPPYIDTGCALVTQESIQTKEVQNIIGGK